MDTRIETKVKCVSLARPTISDKWCKDNCAKYSSNPRPSCYFGSENRPTFYHKCDCTGQSDKSIESEESIESGKVLKSYHLCKIVAYISWQSLTWYDCNMF